MVSHKEWISLSRLAEQASTPEERQRILEELDRLEFNDNLYHPDTEHDA